MLRLLIIVAVGLLSWETQAGIVTASARAGSVEGPCISSNPIPPLCTGSESGPDIESSASANYVNPGFGSSSGNAGGTIGFVRLVPFGVFPANFSGHATATMNNQFDGYVAGFDVSFSDGWVLSVPVGNLPGRIIWRMRLTGDVTGGRGRHYCVTLIGSADFQIEGS